MSLKFSKFRCIRIQSAPPTIAKRASNPTTSHVARGGASSALRRHPLVEFYSAPENQQQRPPAGKRSPHFELRVIGVHEQQPTHQDQYCPAENGAIPRSAIAHRISHSSIQLHPQP